MKTKGDRIASHITSQFKMQDYVSLMIRGKWIMLGTFVVVFGGAAVMTHLAEKTYKATASVKIDTRQMRSSIFNDPSNSAPNANLIQNEIQILKSNALAETVAKKLLDQAYVDSTKKEMILLIQNQRADEIQASIAPLEAVAARVIGSIEFEPVRESDVIKIIAMSRNPKEAALIANSVAQSYFERNLYASRTKTRSFREFLGSQLKTKQQALAKTEEDLRSFMERKGVVSLDDESKKIVEQLSQLEAQRDAVEISIQSLEKTLSSYSEQIAQQEQNVAKVMGEANDPYITQLQAQVAQLEVQKDITISQNPDFVGKEVYNTRLNEIEIQIQALKAKLKKRTDDFLVNLLPSGEGGSGQNDPASYLRSIKQKTLQSQIELQAMQARKTALNQAIQDYNRQFERLPQKNMEFARLQRDKLGTEKLYTLIDEKFNEANITEQGELGYIEIFDPAVVPAAPSSPNVPKNLLVGAVAGLGLGFLLALFRERLQELIRKPEDLKRRGHTVLCTVTSMDREIKPAKGFTGAVAGNHQFDPHLVLASNQLSPIAESYRQLRTNILHLERESSVREILVTSPEPGDGKTTTACNLAIAFAQSGKKVLLMDADLRRPTMHLAFGLQMRPGLHDVFARGADYRSILQTTRIENLQIITSGKVPSNPAEFPSLDPIENILKDARQRYDMVIVDSPPVLSVSDASVVSAAVDLVVLVVSANSTSVTVLERATESLEAVGAKRIGIVLNNFDLRRAYGVAARRSGYGNYGYTDSYHMTRESGHGSRKASETKA